MIFTRFVCHQVAGSAYFYNNKGSETIFIVETDYYSLLAAPKRSWERGDGQIDEIFLKFDYRQ